MIETELLKLFGVNIKRLRLLRGLSQRELASKLGMERSNLAAIEVGKKGASFSTIARLVACLHCFPAELFVPRKDRSVELELTAHLPFLSGEAQKLLKKYAQAYFQKTGARKKRSRKNSPS